MCFQPTQCKRVDGCRRIFVSEWRFILYSGRSAVILVLIWMYCILDEPLALQNARVWGKCSGISSLNPFLFNNYCATICRIDSFCAVVDLPHPHTHTTRLITQSYSKHLHARCDSVCILADITKMSPHCTETTMTATTPTVAMATAIMRAGERPGDVCFLLHPQVKYNTIQYKYMNILLLHVTMSSFSLIYSWTTLLVSLSSVHLILDFPLMKSLFTIISNVAITRQYYAIFCFITSFCHQHDVMKKRDIS